MNTKKMRMFLIGTLAIDVVYNIYFYREDVKMESSVAGSFLVEEQYCRSSKGSSSINVKYKGKLYSVRMANEECLKYPVGSHINLVYNEAHDFFYKKDRLATAKLRVFFFLFLLLISVIPWGRFLEKNALCKS
ncbi:hypothetical protein K7A41_00550 [Sphingobacterium sp. InxBP1]|uniref:hypothetical protein n=1 Tax=Sphingobacterium sp. InxBP1 TaxID=2870328 RepID=UPI00224370A0|nr:hypothetical protein [Sphingobacterium sp. InxBP1]MCW8309710.1 hypothetical protein [Sphingobacterium sp. InxBP1]